MTLKWQDGSQDTATVVSNAGGETPLNDLALLEVKAVRGKVLNLKSHTFACPMRSIYHRQAGISKEF